MNNVAYHELRTELTVAKAGLLAVSKTRTALEIRALYDLGQRDFGENYVQEMVEKQAQLPGDIRWHFIGHLQSNKVRYIAPFVYMIHGVDSEKLLLEISKQAVRQQHSIRCLLQVHIAREETKFGFSGQDLTDLMKRIPGLREENKLDGLQLSGLMGMASLTADQDEIRKEFRQLKILFDEMKKTLPGEPVDTLSMGMSSDYAIALEEGSTLIRIGTLLFGERNNSHDN
jgi:pyridoxal phosphate enzyme (YggS family)